MQHIRVVWKDTMAHENKVYIYRKREIKGFRKGWITDLEGDDNIYQTRHHARNAIDQALGKKGMNRAAGKRAAMGIEIIGKISDYEKAGEIA